MSKFMEFCKKKYKILIPVMVVIVLVIALIFLYKEYKYDNTRNKKEYDVVQYFNGIETKYKATFTYNIKNILVDISAKNVEYDGTPIYMEEEEKVVFPKEMTIVFPLREGSQYKLYKYSTYYKEDGLRYIVNNGDVGQYSLFFLYDGKNVFFFPYEVSLMIGSKEIKLSEMSSVTLTGDSLSYIDYDSKKSEFIELNGKDVNIKSENINVNLKEKYVISFGREVLLFSPNKLNPVFKTIDK